MLELTVDAGPVLRGEAGPRVGVDLDRDPLLDVDVDVGGVGSVAELGS